MPGLAGRVVAILLLAPSAWAANSPDFERFVAAAKGLYGALEFERALEQLEQAKHQPHEANAEVELATFEGILFADLGRQEPSDAAFRTALFLDPDATLTVRVSPKVSERFEELRAQVKATGATRPRPSQTPPSPPPPPQVAAAASPSRAGAWASGAAGVVCAGAATYLLVQARSNWNALQSGAVGSAPAAITTRDQGKADQTGGLIVGGVGAAALATSAWLFLHSGTTPIQPAVSISPAGAGASVRITF
jgi:hypothetical protein